ncbi:MAG: hypothetical protein EOP10_30290 [Proteobacteria bacterium]|nr:MAG: hypothetical protein EOP10_30290 [Pseudomonadota bacterium]
MNFMLLVNDTGSKAFPPDANGLTIVGALLSGRAKPSPEEAQKKFASRSDWVRKKLMGQGITDTGVQDAIVAYDTASYAAERDLSDKYATIFVSIAQNLFTDAQLTSSTNEFRAFVGDEKDRREVAYGDLSQKIELARNPRLDATLMTLGLVGNERLLVASSNHVSGSMKLQVEFDSGNDDGDDDQEDDDDDQ